MKLCKMIEIFVLFLPFFIQDAYALAISQEVQLLDENLIPELKYLNESVDPCEDFYEFSCGNYGKFNPLPPGEKMWDNYYILQKEMDDFCVETMKTEKTSEDPKAVKKVKDMYQACMKYEDYSNYFNVQPMAKAVQELGGWPLISNNLKATENFSWSEVGQIITEYGLPILFSWSIMSYTLNADEAMIYINRDPLLLPATNIITSEEEFHKDVFEDAVKINKRSTQSETPYETYIFKIAKAVCESTYCYAHEEQMKKDIKDVFNIMLAIRDSPNHPRKVDFNKTISNIADLQEWTDSFAKNYRTRMDWLEFFKHAFKNSEASVTKDTKVYVFNTSSIANILDLVENTDQYVIRNFIMSRLTSYMAPDTNKYMWEAYNDLYNLTYKDKYPIYERPDYCKKKITGSQMSYALSYQYHTYFFDNRKIKNAEKLIQELRSSFTELLNEYEWLDEEGKQAATKKLNEMAELLGFPEFTYDETSLDKYYDGLEVCRHDHFGNMQRLRAFNLMKSVDIVGHQRDRLRWTNSPLQVNAYYNPQNNRIVFPAAIMNPPFYSGQFSVLDYGRIGAIIGHEITHGFDSTGANFDGQGNAHPIFSKNVSLTFNKKAQCFTEQYSKYYVDEIKKYVNGLNTLRENIADNGGLREAYKAFLKVLAKENVSFRSEKYNDKQLFFIVFGTNWCRVDTLFSLDAMSKDVHAPNRFRVRGTLSNMQEFSQVFNCAKDAKMNPENKCVLW